MAKWLIAAILSLTPGLDYDEALVHVQAAIAAADEYGYEPEFLLAQAWVESRYRRYDLSRRECYQGECRRVTGVWTKPYPPRRARKSWYCGALQVGGYVSWSRCRELMENVSINYREGAAHLREWERYARKDPECRKYKRYSRARRTCALWGYVGGWRGLKQKTNRYPYRIYRIEKKIRYLVAKLRREEQGNV